MERLVCLLLGEGDAAVFQNETRDAHRTALAYGIKGWAIVAQGKELLQVPDVLADVYQLETRVALCLLLDGGTIGAGLHYEYFYHDSLCFGWFL